MKVFHKIPVFFEGWLPKECCCTVAGNSTCTSFPSELLLLEPDSSEHLLLKSVGLEVVLLLFGLKYKPSW